MRDWEKLEEAVRRLAGRYRLHAAVLFGSRARGDWGPWSDYDLLVIADFREPYLERLSRVLELLEDVDLPIEVHPYTPEETEQMLEKGSPTIVDALEEGVTLYSTPTLQRLREKLEKMRRRGLRRTATTIKVPAPEEQAHDKRIEQPRHHA